jgi:hypothetical protein
MKITYVYIIPVTKGRRKKGEKSKRVGKFGSSTLYVCVEI